MGSIERGPRANPTVPGPARAENTHAGSPPSSAAYGGGGWLVEHEYLIARPSLYLVGRPPPLGSVEAVRADVWIRVGREPETATPARSQPGDRLVEQPFPDPASFVIRQHREHDHFSPRRIRSAEGHRGSAIETDPGPVVVRVETRRPRLHRDADGGKVCAWNGVLSRASSDVEECFDVGRDRLADRQFAHGYSGNAWRSRFGGGWDVHDSGLPKPASGSDERIPKYTDPLRAHAVERSQFRLRPARQVAQGPNPGGTQGSQCRAGHARRERSAVGVGGISVSCHSLNRAGRSVEARQTPSSSGGFGRTATPRRREPHHPRAPRVRR